MEFKVGDDVVIIESDVNYPLEPKFKGRRGVVKPMRGPNVLLTGSRQYSVQLRGMRFPLVVLERDMVLYSDLTELERLMYGI